MDVALRDGTRVAIEEVSMKSFTFAFDLDGYLSGTCWWCSAPGRRFAQTRGGEVYRWWCGSCPRLQEVGK